MTAKKIAIGAAYTLATVKVAIAAAYIAWYVFGPTPTASAMARMSSPMSIDAALANTLGGVSILIIIWLITHHETVAELRAVNNRLAQALTETATIPPAKPSGPDSQED